MEHTISYLHGLLELYAEHPASEDYDPDWSISIGNADAIKFIEMLKGVSGLLYHLGNKKVAAATLLLAHDIDGNMKFKQSDNLSEAKDRLQAELQK